MLYIRNIAEKTTYCEHVVGKKMGALTSLYATCGGYNRPNLLSGFELSGDGCNGVDEQEMVSTCAYPINDFDSKTCNSAFSEWSVVLDEEPPHKPSPKNTQPSAKPIYALLDKKLKVECAVGKALAGWRAHVHTNGGMRMEAQCCDIPNFFVTDAKHFGFTTNTSCTESDNNVEKFAEFKPNCGENYAIRKWRVSDCGGDKARIEYDCWPINLHASPSPPPVANPYQIPYCPEDINTTNTVVAGGHANYAQSTFMLKTSHASGHGRAVIVPLCMVGTEAVCIAEAEAAVANVRRRSLLALRGEESTADAVVVEDAAGHLGGTSLYTHVDVTAHKTPCGEVEGKGLEYLTKLQPVGKIGAEGFLKGWRMTAPGEDGCAAGEAAIAASVIEPVVAFNNNTCRHFHTGAQRATDAKASMLDRYPVDCPEAMALTDWFMHKVDSGAHMISYTCCDVPAWNYVNAEPAKYITKRDTGCSREGNGMLDSVAKHDVQCGMSAAMTGWHFKRCDDADKWTVEYECVAVNLVSMPPSPPPAPPPPPTPTLSGCASRRITLTGGKNDDKFCTPDDHGYLKCASTTTAGPDESFKIVERPSDDPPDWWPEGFVALKAEKWPGKYCADEGANGIKCNRDSVNSWEVFKFDHEIDYSDVKEAICYGERYTDLVEDVCGGGRCVEKHVRELEDHWRKHGQKEGRTHGCYEKDRYFITGGQEKALCYEDGDVRCLKDNKEDFQQRMWVRCNSEPPPPPPPTPPPAPVPPFPAVGNGGICPFGRVALKFPYKQSTWCGVRGDDLDRISCNLAHHLGDAERFDIVDRPPDASAPEHWPQGYVAIKSVKTGKYCADEGANGIKCNRDTVGSWEVFMFEPVHFQGGENAVCYGNRHDDLRRDICGGKECDESDPHIVNKLLDHWKKHGKEEGRHFGCVSADGRTNIFLARGGRQKQICTDFGRVSCTSINVHGAYERMQVECIDNLAPPFVPLFEPTVDHEGWTGCNDLWAKRLEFMDRHHVGTFPNFMSMFQQTASGCHRDNQQRYIHHYQTGVTGFDQSTCSQHYTGWNEVRGKEIVFLDRHHVNCPDGKGLTDFKMQTGGHNGRFEYRCCEIPRYDITKDMCEDVLGGHTEPHHTMDWLAPSWGMRVECKPNYVFTGWRIGGSGRHNSIRYYARCCPLNVVNLPPAPPPPSPAPPPPEWDKIVFDDHTIDKRFTKCSPARGKTMDWLDDFNTRTESGQLVGVGESDWKKPTLLNGFGLGHWGRCEDEQMSFLANVYNGVKGYASDADETCTRKYTGYREAEGKFLYEFLQHHAVQCPVGQALKQWGAQQNGKQAQLWFDCCSIPNFNQISGSCRAIQTGNTEGKSIDYLDRVHVWCDKREVMTAWKFRSARGAAGAAGLGAAEHDRATRHAMPPPVDLFWDLGIMSLRPPRPPWTTASGRWRHSAAPSTSITCRPRRLRRPASRPWLRELRYTQSKLNAPNSSARVSTT